jgi:hypothetical protein
MRKRFSYVLNLGLFVALAMLAASCGGSTAPTAKSGTSTTPVVTTLASPSATTSTPASTTTAMLKPGDAPPRGTAWYAKDLSYYAGGDYYIVTNDINVLYDVSQAAEGRSGQWRAYIALTTDPWAAKAQIVCAYQASSTTASGTSVTAPVYIVSDGSSPSTAFATAFCTSQGK